MMLNYAEPVYRPPSEAKSLIFQVTLGCSFNQCSFCDMYRNKEYSEKTWDEVKAEIDLMAKQLPDTTRIFLADGDAINTYHPSLAPPLASLSPFFPPFSFFSFYTMPMNLLKKTPEELKKMREAGLKMLYLGIESGSDIILKKITKGATAETIIIACRKAIETGFTLSCIIILGLGGKTHSKEHIKETARVVSASSPHYLGTLTLILETGVKQEFLTKFGEEFHPINDAEALIELHDLVEQIDVKEKMLFRANHGSNAYNIAGTFPDEKNAMLEKISWLKEHPENVRPEGFRAF